MEKKITVIIPKGSDLNNFQQQPPTAAKVKQNLSRSYVTEQATEPQIEKRAFVFDNEKNRMTQVVDYLRTFYDLRNNIITCEIEYKEKKTSNWTLLNERTLTVELRKNGFPDIRKDLIDFLLSDYITKYDPFLSYFENLPTWNGTTDHIAELASYVDAKNKDWFNRQFKKMLVRSVAGAIKAIPFNKHCFVLLSKQNDGKSSFLRFLCPPPLQKYYTESIDTENKDGRIALCQNFFITLDDLDSLEQKGIGRIKAFMSYDNIKERLPYAAKAVTFPRRASLLGSTNKREFLTDETGNVRWLIFEINGIKHDNGKSKGYSKNIDINKVWAQAYHLFKSSFDFQLTKDELKYSETANTDDFSVTTSEKELLQAMFRPSDKSDPKAEFLTATEILVRIQNRTVLKIDNSKIGKALVGFGFEQKQVFFKEKGYQKKGYYVNDVSNY